MSIFNSNIRPYNKWDWDGGTIVYKPIIEKARHIINTGQMYKIDIREFLSRSENAVLKDVLKNISNDLNENERWLFTSHEKGSFDFRVQKIQEYISNNIAYRGQIAKKFDNWLFPEETIAGKRGDCEDRSILLAALMIASGISSYMVRVALGKLYEADTQRSYDHVWVMYKNESGNWMLLECMLFVPPSIQEANKKSVTPVNVSEVEYIPYFLFNDDHLWQVNENTVDTDFKKYITDKRHFWKKFNPCFSAKVHNNIIDKALADAPYWERLWIKLGSLAMDSVKSYDPRDHFDNGYIMESWQVIDDKLSEGTISGLTYAVHAVSDFYAHTSYACFAKKDNAGQIKLFDRTLGDDLFGQRPEYGKGFFNLKDPRFTTNKAYCPAITNADIDLLNHKKIISGRFSQYKDPAQSVLEKYFTYIPYELRQRDYLWRCALPHHDEIAVDKALLNGKKIPGNHKLYKDEPALFAEQVQLRASAAARHVKQIYTSWHERYRRK